MGLRLPAIGHPAIFLKPDPWNTRLRRHVSDAEFGADFNRVIGADIALRHGGHFRWNASALSAHSRSAARVDTQGGMAQVSYSFNSQRVTVGGQLEHFSDEFRMDTAFFNQPALTRTWQYGELQFYPDRTGNGWLKRVAPFVWATRADNRLQGTVGTP